MTLLAGAMCGVRNDSCSRQHNHARTSHGMAPESLLRGVDLFFAQEFCFFKQEHGPPRGSKQAKTDVLLMTVLVPLRRDLRACHRWKGRDDAKSAYSYVAEKDCPATRASGPGGRLPLCRLPRPRVARGDGVQRLPEFDAPAMTHG